MKLTDNMILSEQLSEAEQLNMLQKLNESLRKEVISIYDLLINELRQLTQMCDSILSVALFKKQMVDDIMNKLNPVIQIMKGKYDTPKVTASVSGLFQQAQSEPDSADVENRVMLEGSQ